MKYILLLVIRIYWTIIPKSNRRKCLFKKSCSTFVYDEANQHGFYVGLKALKYRMEVCNGHAQFFNDPITGERSMILSNGEVIGHEKISGSFK